jgi:subtilase family serine protease
MPIHHTRRYTALAMTIAVLLIALVGVGFLFQKTHAASPLVTLPNTTSPAIDSAKVVGPLSATTPLALTIALPSKDQSGLDHFTQSIVDPSSPWYHQFLTTAQFDATFGANPSQVQQIKGFLQNAGLQITGEQSGGLFINAKGTAGQVASAFHTSFNMYQWPSGAQFYANAQPITVPLEVVGSILTVSGLNNAPLYSHAPSAIKQEQDDGQSNVSCPTGTPSQLTPAMLATAYNFPASISGNGQRIGLYELDGYNAANIAAFASCFAPSSNVANLVQKRLVGTSSPLHPGNNQVEVELDAEIALGLAPGIAGLDIYEAQNTSRDALDELVAIANDNTDGIVSISWGACENAISQSGVQAEDNAFKQMVAQGQSVFVATGDTGAYACAALASNSSSAKSISDLAGSPNVVAVGGTNLQVNSNGTYLSEVVWNNGPSSGTAGSGGVSKYWPAPLWQTMSGATTDANPKRTIPDITADGDPHTGYLIYSQSGGSARWMTIGGTSAATPLWAALQARTNQLANARLGLITPSLYALYSADKNANRATGITANSITYFDYATQVNGSSAPANAQIAFHDITSGDNGFGTSKPGYLATTGFDAASGLGSMNGTVLSNFLAALGPGGGMAYFNGGNNGDGSPTVTPTPSPTVTPTPSPSPSPKLYVVAKGTNNAYWISTATTSSASQQWTQLDKTHFQGAPAVTDFGTTGNSPQLIIAGIGIDGIFLVNTYDPLKHILGEWVAVPGVTCQGDAAIDHANDKILVACRTTQNTIAVNVGILGGNDLATIGWDDWNTLTSSGISATASPVIAANGNMLTIMVQGANSGSTSTDWVITYNATKKSVQTLQQFASTCASTPSLAYRGSTTDNFVIGCIDKVTKATWVSTFSTTKNSVSSWIKLGIPSGAQLRNTIVSEVDTLDGSQTAFHAVLGTNNTAYLDVVSKDGQVLKQWMVLTPPNIPLTNLAIHYSNY